MRFGICIAGVLMGAVCFGGEPEIPDIAPLLIPERAAANDPVVKAARQVYEGLLKKENIVPLTPEFLALKIKYSQRIRDAELAVAEDKEDRLTAAQEHLERMTQTYQRISRINFCFDTNVPQISMAEEAMLEAKLAAEREKK